MLEQSRERAIEIEESPEPSAELTLIRWCLCAYVASCHLRPRARGPAFVRELARLAEAEQKIAAMRPSRAAFEIEGSIRARRQAEAALSLLLPALIASLPGEDS